MGREMAYRGTSKAVSDRRILIISELTRLADLALRARRPRERGVQRMTTQMQFEELYFTLSSASARPNRTGRIMMSI